MLSDYIFILRSLTYLQTINLALNKNVAQLMQSDYYMMKSVTILINELYLYSIP